MISSYQWLKVLGSPSPQSSLADKQPVFTSRSSMFFVFSYPLNEEDFVCSGISNGWSAVAILKSRFGARFVRKKKTFPEVRGLLIFEVTVKIAWIGPIAWFAILLQTLKHARWNDCQDLGAREMIVGSAVTCLSVALAHVARAGLRGRSQNKFLVFLNCWTEVWVLWSVGKKRFAPPRLRFCHTELFWYCSRCTIDQENLPCSAFSYCSLGAACINHAWWPKREIAWVRVQRSARPRTCYGAVFHTRWRTGLNRHGWMHRYHWSWRSWTELWPFSVNLQLQVQVVSAALSERKVAFDPRRWAIPFSHRPAAERTSLQLCQFGHHARQTLGLTSLHHYLTYPYLHQRDSCSLWWWSPVPMIDCMADL